jgi:hypothetical protein
VELFDSIPDLHTMAQLARRAGISEGRARALHADKKLPRSDSKDADGRPLWLPSTIDAWCRQTGRPLGEEVAWVYRAEAATEPAPMLFHGTVEAESHGPISMHVIVWDTPNGHIVYLTPIYDDQGVRVNATSPKTAIAMLTAQLVEPAFWATALVVEPLSLSFGDPGEIVYLSVYQLELDPQDKEPALRRLGLHRQKTNAGRPPRLRVRFEGTLIWPEELARAIGTPVPMWIEQTCTREAVQRAQAYNSTFTVKDTITEWTPTLRRLDAALEAGMQERFPAAFAALAADAQATLEDIRTHHARQALRGPGWYVVARPAMPELPITTDRIIASAELSEDLDAVTADLEALRRIEPDLSVNAPEGDAFEGAIDLLTWQLQKHRADVAIDYTTPYDDEFAGPVIDQWRQTLTEVDRSTALKTRRVQRLLGPGRWHNAEVEQVLRDPAGRYVAVIKSQSRSNGLDFSAEWPHSLPTGWNEKTIIAADPGLGAVFALTPTDDGRLRVDPVPFEQRTVPSFRYGYRGGSPATLYQALIRCVFEQVEKAPFTLRQVTDNFSGPDVSQLWNAIATTEGPLRLPWPQVQLWARADAKKVGYPPARKRQPPKR